MMSGRRRETLVLVQQKSESDGQWGPAVTWVEVSQIWVSIEPMRGREIFSANERESVVTHRIRGDYMEIKALTPDMRVIMDPSMSYSTIPADSRVFNILAVMPDFDGKGDGVMSVAEEGRRYGAIQTSANQ